MYYCEICGNYREEDEMDWTSKMVDGLPTKCLYYKEEEND